MSILKMTNETLNYCKEHDFHYSKSAYPNGCPYCKQDEINKRYKYGDRIKRRNREVYKNGKK